MDDDRVKETDLLEAVLISSQKSLSVLSLLLLYP